MSSGATWALFGGSFDPPHVGHVLVASYVLATHAERIVIVPAFQHVFGKDLTPFPHRRRMLELAMADLREVEISDIEARLGGASATVRTLDALRERHPGVAWQLVIGSDLVDDIPRWTEGERLLSMASLCVVQRAGHSQGDGVVMPDISSTDIRARLARGESTGDRLPRAVAEYCRKHALYRAG
jgi:nicotinate-nucleotide adenylyltransferase